MHDEVEPAPVSEPSLCTARPIAYLLLPGSATTGGGDSCGRRGKHLTTAELVLNKPREIEKRLHYMSRTSRRADPGPNDGGRPTQGPSR